MMPRPPATLFSFIDQIRSKETWYDYDPKIAPAFLLLMGLSNYNPDLKTCNAINHLLWPMPSDMIYKYFFEAIPKGKRFVKWPKKEKSKKIDKEIKALKEKYNISTYEAKLLLGDNE